MSRFKNKVVARQGGGIAGGARKKLEKRLGRSVITDKNFANILEEKRRVKGGNSSGKEL